MRKVVRIRYIIIIAIFVAITITGVSLAFAMGDAYALSALSNGAGTKDDPYVIRDVNQMSNLLEIAASDYSEQYTKDKYFRLESDFVITLNQLLSNNGFYGHLDGNGHTVQLPTNGRLFRYLKSGSSVSNLTVENFVTWQDNSYRYGLTDIIEQDAVVDNVTVKSNIDIDFTDWAERLTAGYYLYCGGFARYNYGTISNCTFQGNIKQITEYITNASGSRFELSCFAPMGNGRIVNCKAYADIEIYVNTNYNFGVSGFSNNNFVDNCYFKGNIRVISSYWLVGYGARVMGIGALGTNSTYEGNVIYDLNGNGISNTILTSQKLGVGYDDSCTIINGEVMRVF